MIRPCMVLLLCGTSVVHAADSNPGVPLPGLESDPPGTVAPGAAAVTLIEGQVTVDTVAIPHAEMPALMLTWTPFTGTGESDPYPDRQFPELSVTLDGAKIDLPDLYQAFKGGRDITNLIRGAEMDPWAITKTPPVTTASTRFPGLLHALSNLAAISATDDGRFLAKWSIRRIIRFPLKPAGAQHIALRYTARPAFSRLPAAELLTPSRQADYCVSEKSLHRWNSRTVSVREYDISSGIDGVPPSAVTVSLSPGSEPGRAHGVAFACGPHGKPLVTEGSWNAQPVQADRSGRLRVLVVEP